MPWAKHVVAWVVIAQLIWSPVVWGQASRSGKQGGGSQALRGAGKGQGQGQGSKAARGGGGGGGGVGGGVGGGGGVAKGSVPGGRALSHAVVPDQYILGPGDALAINLWGEYDDFQEVEVSPEGKITLPTIGELQLKGVTLTQAETLLATEVKRYYRNVKSGITLTALRAFEVAVLGAVNEPGSYLATPVKRVSDLIVEAGGVSPGGSRRHIQVKRDGRIRATADLSAYLRRGEESANPRLQDGDVIFVLPLRGARVEVFDEARVEGMESSEDNSAAPVASTPHFTFELKDGERFSHLIFELGGANPLWDLDSIYVVREAPGTTDKMKISVKVRELVFGKDESKDIVLQDGDVVFFARDTRRRYLNSLGELIGIEKENLQAPAY